jgi:NCS1 family nucleobase:cation symporter-1
MASAPSPSSHDLSKHDPHLWNHDLAPTRPEHRTWSATHFAALWIGMAVCIPTYKLAGDLLPLGMSAWQALLTIALGNLIVLVPMILNAHAGAKYGVPFPVLARASFGVYGANIPAVLRAIVACGWFGIQAWIGGDALHQLAIVADIDWIHIPAFLPDWFGISEEAFLAFLLFWAVNVFFIWRGTESIKWLEMLASPFLIVIGIVLLVWAYIRADGFGEMLSKPSAFTTTGEFFEAFLPGLTSMVGFWATLSLNIPDFTRFARSQKDQVWGQAIGLPTTMILYSFIGVAVTSASSKIFGKEISDPVNLIAAIGGTAVVVVAMLALSIATLTTNIAANVVSPANDFSNLAPGKISYRLGGYITAIFGILIFPWKLIETTQGYIFTWLVGYSALLGPVGGILIFDYFVVRKRVLDVDALYRADGVYRYSRGFNPAALVAFVAGVAPNIPGFLAEAGAIAKTSVPDAFHYVYKGAWFVGFFGAGLLYWALMYARARRSVSSGPTRAP